MHESPKEGDALESNPTRPQTSYEVGTIIMDWMDKESFTFQRASELIGISRSNLTHIVSGYQFSDDIRLKLSNTVPGVNP
jgi:predicted XRE-type DNA-binding protein